MAAIAIFLAGLCGALLWLFPLPAWALRADELVIVSNRAVAASGKLARYYMERRQVSKQNWLQLRTTGQEQISRDDYEKQIAAPLRTFLQKNDPDGVRFKCIVLMYDGVAKSPPYYVAALFQDFDILYVCLHP